MQIPRLPKAVPRRGNALTRLVGRLSLQMLGWRFAGNLPDLPRFVLVVAPHTSNWDFVVGVSARLALGMDVSWLGKHTLFKGPLRGVLYWLRGIPVNRMVPHGLIGQLSRRFRDADQFVLALAPEGTRSKVSKWKTGFYFIALQAGVPIVPAYLDYGRKIVGFHEPLMPTGHLEEEMAQLRELYVSVQARCPEKF